MTKSAMEEAPCVVDNEVFDISHKSVQGNLVEIVNCVGDLAGGVNCLLVVVWGHNHTDLTRCSRCFGLDLQEQDSQNKPTKILRCWFDGRFGACSPEDSEGLHPFSYSDIQIVM